MVPVKMGPSPARMVLSPILEPMVDPPTGRLISRPTSALRAVGGWSLPPLSPTNLDRVANIKKKNKSLSTLQRELASSFTRERKQNRVQEEQARAISRRSVKGELVVLEGKWRKTLARLQKKGLKKIKAESRRVKRIPRSIGHITPLYCKYDSDEEAEEERKVGTRPELDMSRKGMGSNY
jgi:hypothetical protein